MKNLMKSMFSAFCVMSMAMPAAGQPLAGENLIDTLEDRGEQRAKSQYGNDNYHLALLSADFSLQLVDAESRKKTPLSTLRLFVSSPEGRIVKDAQVVMTIIDGTGNQHIQRAYPYKGGYVIDIDHLLNGHYRVEAEIVVGGRLLADEFTFFKS